MGIGDIRYTVLQTVQEVFRKLLLAQPNTLSDNSLTRQCVDFINDVCNDLADSGEWQETLVTANITAVSGNTDYTISTSANVENIKDIYFSQRRGALTNITIDDMRVLSRVTATGTPAQYTIFGTDNNGNPNIRVRPIPAQTEDGGLFSILYYIRAPLYTVNDGATIIPYPARVVVLGTLARVYLNEAGGAPNDKYNTTFQDYQNSKKQALNRFNGDTGWNISFKPSMLSRRSR